MWAVGFFLSVHFSWWLCLLYQKAFHKLPAMSGAVMGTCVHPHLSSPTSCSGQATPLGSRFTFAPLSPSLRLSCLPLDKPAVCAGVIYGQMVIFLAVVEFSEMYSQLVFFFLPRAECLVYTVWAICLPRCWGMGSGEEPCLWLSPGRGWSRAIRRRPWRFSDLFRNGSLFTRCHFWISHGALHLPV